MIAQENIVVNEAFGVRLAVTESLPFRRIPLTPEIVGRFDRRVSGDFEFASAVDAFDQPLDNKFGWLQGVGKLLKGKRFWLRGPATIRIV